MNPNRTSCGEVRDKLPLYVGGDLDPDVLDAVRGHLDLCGECARRAARAAGARRVLLASFQGSEGDVTQPGLWSGIRARLHSEGLIHEPEQTVVHAPVASARRARWSWALAPLAAAAVVMLILEVSGGLAPSRGPEVLPGPQAPSPAPFVAMPVSAPVGGSLQRIDPRDARLAAPYPTRRVEGQVPGAGGVSLAGYNSRIK